MSELMREHECMTGAWTTEQKLEVRIVNVHFDVQLPSREDVVALQIYF